MGEDSNRAQSDLWLGKVGGRNRVAEVWSNYSDLLSFVYHVFIVKVEELHAPYPLFSSCLKYFLHSAKVNLRVWSLLRHDTSFLAFH